MHQLFVRMDGKDVSNGVTLACPSCSTVLGAGFLLEAHLMWQRARRSDELTVVRPMRLFHWSNMYLSLLFVAVALDPLIKL